MENHTLTRKKEKHKLRKRKQNLLRKKQRRLRKGKNEKEEKIYRVAQTIQGSKGEQKGGTIKTCLSTV